MPQIETATLTRNTAYTTIYDVPGVIKIEIPKAINDCRFPGEEGGEVHMVQFARSITGGVINFFVHLRVEADSEKFRGKRIFARAIIRRKSMPNGARFMFVDLYPADDQSERQADSTLVVVPRVSDTKEMEGEIFFHPTPLQNTKELTGAIVVTEVKKTVMGPKKEPVPAETSPIEIVEEVPAPPIKMVDKQLARFKTEGWKVETKTDTTVILRKRKGGKIKKITHTRPK